MRWLIEKDVFGDGLAQKFSSAICSHPNQLVKIAEYVPFDEEQIFNQFESGEPVFVYGSINLIKRLQYQANTNQFKSHLIDYSQWDMFRTSVIYNRFKGYTLSDEYCIATVREVQENLQWFFNKYAYDIGNDCFEVFAKSNEGDKRFNGSLYNFYTLDESLKNNLNCEYITPDDLLIIASPSKIKSEYRVVVSDGKVVTGSCYLNRGDLIEKPNDILPSKVKNFVEDVLNQTMYNPAPVFVVDVGECIYSNRKEKLKVIETGSINMCGLYGCNIQKIVTKLIQLNPN